MAERFTADLLFILFVLLVAAILGFLIGYFLSLWKMKNRILILEKEKASQDEKIRMLEEDRARLEKRLSELEEEKKAWQAEYEMLTKENTLLKLDLDAMRENAASLNLKIGLLEKELGLLKGKPLPMAETQVKPKMKPDDLKVVLGIGPKISRLLKNRGITTWRALSEVSPARLKEILLTDGGERYHIHDPSSWPHQGLLLSEGRWEELKAQYHLDLKKAGA